MRAMILAASLAFGLTACVDAQKLGGAADAMPILSAANTIDACLGRYSELAEREAQCIGQYSSACMSLRPDGETNDAWDARLNTAYSTYMQSLDPPRDAGLREAQRAWMALRDADCSFEASAFEGGSMQPLVSAGCQRDYAARRTLRLLDWIDQQG